MQCVRLQYGQGLMGRAKMLRQLSSSHFLKASDREERYLQYSKVPTMHFQPSLPRLPVPKLSDTGSRYLCALRPLVQEEQYQETERLVGEFVKEGGDGDALNRRLILKDSENKHTSYISGPWYDMYLASRLPLPLNYNPFLGFLMDPRTSNQADRAANFIYSAVRFRNTLLDHKLEPEIYHLNPEKSDTQRFRNIIRFVPSSFSWYGAYLVKAFPLDMSQYNRLFNSTRIPQQGKDELLSFGRENRHLVVMRKGNFYSVDVVQSNGLPVAPSEIHSRLNWILSDPHPSPSHPLGYLTTINRDKWAALREELVTDERNRQSLEKIDSSLFLLCLDDVHLTEDKQKEAFHALLHNRGQNRWFDKSFSLIVMPGGLSAINFEHAWGDGVAILRFFNEVWKDTTEKPYVPQGTVSLTDSGVEPLSFNLSDNVKSAIDEARSEMEAQAHTLDVELVEYMKYGKNLIKKQGLSPDGLLQLALQLAYYRQYKCSVPTYESCSTAAFRHGRTETIRSASNATKACAESFDPGHPAGVEEMLQKVKEATAWHSKLTREAAMGQGFDRHLFALRTLAESEKLTMPIFEDPSYSYINHIILSTSTLSADAVLLGGFAPVTQDGYGVGYNVQDEAIRFQVCTYPTRDGHEFASNVQRSLDNLNDLLHGNNFKQ